MSPKADVWPVNSGDSPGHLLSAEHGHNRLPTTQRFVPSLPPINFQTPIFFFDLLSPHFLFLAESSINFPGALLE
jgi:hypothetical protein